MNYIFTLVVISSFNILPSLARAAGPGEVGDDNLKLKDTLAGGPNDVLKIINNLIDWIFTIALVLAVIFMLLANRAI